jgi:hypothetical protein
MIEEDPSKLEMAWDVLAFSFYFLPRSEEGFDEAMWSPDDCTWPLTS